MNSGSGFLHPPSSLLLSASVAPIGARKLYSRNLCVPGLGRGFANKALELLGKAQGMFQERRSGRREWEPELPYFHAMSAEEIIRRMANDVRAADPALMLIDQRHRLKLPGKRDELVSIFRAQLQQLDPGITVFDPQAGSLLPEGGDQGAEVMH